MIKLEEEFYMAAYTDKGQLIRKEKMERYPTSHELDQFANGCQQADYLKVDREYRYKVVEKLN